MPKDNIRVDKWLWAVRIFKSRSKASATCKNGRVRSNDRILKPSSGISVGDVIELKKDGFNMSYKVLKLIEKRTGYAIASQCYENLTPEEELNKFKEWFVGKGQTEFREKGTGRPTKKDRREIVQFKKEIFLDDWFDQK